MSHCVSIDVQFGDISSLAIAVAAAATHQIHASQHFKQTFLSAVDEMQQQGITTELKELPPGTDLVLETKQGSRIGMKLQADRTLALTGVNTDQAQGLRQQYAYQKSKKDLLNQGFNVVAEEVDANGSIKLLGRRWKQGKEEFEVLIPPSGHVTYQALGMPPSRCQKTVEQMALRLGRVVAHHSHQDPQRPVVRIFETPCG